MIDRGRTDDPGDAARDADGGAIPAELSLDDVHHLLQTKRRRDVLRYLRDAEGPVRLRELAEQVAAWEQETTVEELRSDERQRVYISLYQSHLPKLDNHGIIEYDKDRGRVDSTLRTGQLEPYLEGPTETDSSDPWPRRYGATVGLGTVFLGAVAAGLAPIDGLVAAGLVLGSFAAVTSVHAWTDS
ncbi:hypothetical protein ACERIM_11985 [Natrinema sp. H-ect1]|uniref:DUF7344 domain-containing protein n=1 Tax=Natrinema sp. H-ect1 TaxID=3242700 RepID=UPI00359E2B26